MADKSKEQRRLEQQIKRHKIGLAKAKAALSRIKTDKN